MEKLMNSNSHCAPLCSALFTLSLLAAAVCFAAEPESLRPVGEGKGTHPGRVVWVHNPEATHWNGTGDGHWWQPEHTLQDQVDRMMSRAVCDLTGESTEARAWDKLLRYSNQTRGKGDVGYRPGEKIAVKVNFVGLIW